MWSTLKNSISLLLLLFIFQHSSLAQLPKKIQNLAGTWNYQGGSGYEIFQVQNGELYGESYLKTKVGMTYYVEQIRVKYVNKNLIYETIPVKGDSLIHSKKSTFISEGRRMKFEHTDNSYPEAVKYKIGCFNKNKLKITIYPIVEEQKKKVLRLTRNVDGTL